MLCWSAQSQAFASATATFYSSKVCWEHTQLSLILLHGVRRGACSAQLRGHQELLKQSGLAPSARGCRRGSPGHIDRHRPALQCGRRSAAQATMHENQCCQTFGFARNCSHRD
eukprot:355798-Chlamydomonas_euryale.AAC.8